MGYAGFQNNWVQAIILNYRKAHSDYSILSISLLGRILKRWTQGGAHARSRGIVMLQLRSKETLDRGDYGWLTARHHFVVSAKGNLANGPLSALVVWNDDEIAPGTGFGHHTHTDMEIVTYVRQGVVTHEDSAGNVGHTVAGNGQGVSAARGVSPSEHNYRGDPLKL